jgi:hypothetical protein
MNFGEAILTLKNGGRVARAGWNGKGMFLFLVTPKKTSDMEDDVCNLNLPGTVDDTWSMPQRPVIVMKDAEDHLVIGWLASQTDILAEDWETHSGYATLTMNVESKAADPGTQILPLSEKLPIKPGDFVRIHNGGGRGRVIRIQCAIQSDQGGHVTEDIEHVAHLTSNVPKGQGK